MISNLDPLANGPSPEAFAQIAKMMPKFVAEAKAKAGGKVPCAICFKHFGSALKANTKPFCPSCSKELTTKVAFVTLATHRAIFMWSESLPPNWVGTVRVLKEHEMDKLEAKMKEKQAHGNGQ